ncbi:hypothetical protein D9M71_314110 [compost metagenome]
MHFAFVVAGAAALDQAELFQAFEQRRERAGVEHQALAQGLHRGLRRRFGLPFPEHQHHQVLRVGQAERVEHRPVATDDRPRGGVQAEAQLVVQQQFRFGGQRPALFAHFSSASISETMCSGLVSGAKRLITLPSLPIRNLVKFHLMRWLPSAPGARFFSST